MARNVANVEVLPVANVANFQLAIGHWNWILAPLAPFSPLGDAEAEEAGGGIPFGRPANWKWHTLRAARRLPVAHLAVARERDPPPCGRPANFQWHALRSQQAATLPH